jgi:hypothetical protein
MRETIGSESENESASTHLQIIQHDASERIVQLEHLVHDAAEGSRSRARRGKVVDKPSNESVRRIGRHIRKDAFKEQQRWQGW